RNAEHCIEDRECSAIKEADFSVADAEVVFDFLGEDRQHLPVDEVEDEHEDEHEQHVARIASADFDVGICLTLQRLNDFGVGIALAPQRSNSPATIARI